MISIIAGYKLARQLREEDCFYVGAFFGLFELGLEVMFIAGLVEAFK